MIRFSAFLPIRALFRVSAPSKVFFLISAPISLSALIPISALILLSAPILAYGYVYINRGSSSFKVFRYSFLEAIPIFFNRLKSGFFLLRSLFTSNWLWIEIYENVVLSKITITFLLNNVSRLLKM